MSRLTNKKLVYLKYGEFLSVSKEEYRKQVHEAPTYKEIYTKLGKLEDLEDELGCPLEIVFKALKEGIYIKDLPKGYEKRKVTLNYLIKGKMFYFIPSAPYCYKLFLKDYGKTWWLKGDRSE